MRDNSTLNRRSFLEFLVGTAALGALGCGPAHKIGDKWGWCCDSKHNGPRAKPGAALVGAKGAQFDENRLIDKINSKEPIYEPDDDLFGFVNSLYQKMHGVPVPGHLTYEISTNTLGGGVVGRYIAGHIVLAPGLTMDKCVHFLLHEIGHDFDTVVLSEAVAEFEAVRGTLESLVTYPRLNRETNFALLEYAIDWLEMWGRAMPGHQYGSASQLSVLSLIKNQGDLALAQQDINLFYLSQIDAERAYSENQVSKTMSSSYYFDELKDMAMAAWLGRHEKKVPAEDVLNLVTVMRERETKHENNLILPPGILIPVNYADYLSRPVAEKEVF